MSFVAFMSWNLMVHATCWGLPPDGATPQWANLYRIVDTPLGGCFIATVWISGLTLLLHNTDPSVWAFGIAILSAWVTRLPQELQEGGPPGWWLRMVSPLYVSYFGLPIGLCTRKTRLARWFTRRLEHGSVRRPAFLGPALLVAAGALFYVFEARQRAFEAELWRFVRYQHEQRERDLNPVRWLMLLQVMGALWIAGFGLVLDRLPSKMFFTVFTSLLLVDMAGIYLACHLLDRRGVKGSDMELWVQTVRYWAFKVYFALVSGVILVV